MKHYTGYDVITAGKLQASLLWRYAAGGVGCIGSGYEQVAETKRSWTIELLVRLQNLNTKLSRKLLLQNYDAAFFKQTHIKYQDMHLKP